MMASLLRFPNVLLVELNKTSRIIIKKVLVDEDMDYYEREVIQDELPSGLYQLDKDEITVKQIYQTSVF